MGLPNIIQIPCHHVLANQNALKFKMGAPLKLFWALPIEIQVKAHGDMSKIWTRKVVFSFLPPKLINIILIF